MATTTPPTTTNGSSFRKGRISYFNHIHIITVFRNFHLSSHAGGRFFCVWMCICCLYYQLARCICLFRSLPRFPHIWYHSIQLIVGMGQGKGKLSSHMQIDVVERRILDIPPTVGIPHRKFSVCLILFRFEY